MAQITLADGTALTVPENPTQADLDQIHEADKLAQTKITSVDVPASANQPLGMQYNDGKPAYNLDQPTSTDLGTPLNIGRSVLGSIGRGLGGLASQASNLVSGDLDTPQHQSGESPEASQLINELQKRQDQMTNFIPNLLGDKGPTTSGGRIADAAIQAATGSMLLPGRSLANALTGAMSGATGATAGEVVGNDKPRSKVIAEILGALAGGGAAHGVGSILPNNTADILQRVVTDPAAIRHSAFDAEMARQKGVPLNTLDALPGSKSPLTDIQDALMANGGADKVAANIRAQGPALVKLANKTVADLPGKVMPEQSVANTVQDTATDVAKSMKADASKAFASKLAEVKATRLAPLLDDKIITGDDLAAAKDHAAQIQPNIDQLNSEDATARAAADRVNVKTTADANRLDLLKGAQETVNPPLLKTENLGNFGQLLNARRVQLGKGELASWSPTQLKTAGMPADLVDELVAKAQPVTQGTTTVQTDNTIDPVGPTAMGKLGDKLSADTQQQVDDAAQAHGKVIADIAGIDQLTPEAKDTAKAKINEIIQDKQGDQGLVTDLTHIRDGVDNLDTSKQLHNYILSLKQDLPSVKLNSRPANVSETSVIGSAIGPLKELRDTATPAYGAADQVYRDQMAAKKTTYAGSDLGALSGPGGSQIERDAAKTRVFRLLSEGESPNVAPEDSRLKATLNMLGRQDKDTLNNTVKSYLDKSLGDIFGRAKEARPSASAGKDLTGVLGDSSNSGNDPRVHGLHIAMDALANANKMTSGDRAALHNGIDQLRDIANASSRTTANPTSMSAKELSTMAENPGGLVALRLIGISPGNALLRPLQGMIQRGTFRKLDDLLSNPDKVEQLIALGKVPRLTRTQRSAFASAIGFAGATNAENSKGAE